MKYYNEISKGYNELHKSEQLNKIKIICGEYDFIDKKILDIGSGPCYLLEYLIENNIKFKSYTGIDPSINLLKLSKYYPGNNKIKFIKSKIEDFKLNKYDVIVIISSIHHFNNINIIKKLKAHAKDFIFSIYKKSKDFDKIKEILKKNFKIKSIITEKKDVIFFI